MKTPIFYLEGRGGMYLFHFFILNLGGLYYILNKNYNYRHIDSIKLNNSNLVNQPSFGISFPIKIYMQNILLFQKEAFEIIKDKFELIEDLTQISNYELISIYGEKCNIRGTCDNPVIIYPFLRNLFLDYCKFSMIPGKRIFITRKNSESQHGGILKRSIINEDVMINMLNKYNFEYIQLENYSMLEKIKLFMESEIILSPHSSALVLILFLDPKTKIIELLNKGTIPFCHHHYKDIAEHLYLNYFRYSDISEDKNGNFNIDIDKFEYYLLNLL